MSDAFTDAEVGAIRKLAKLWADAGGIDKWINANADDGRWVSNCAFVGFDKKGGLLFNEYGVSSSYGEYELDHTPNTISSRALTDPEGWADYLVAKKAKDARDYEARKAAELLHREAQERAAYEALKQKFG